MFYIDMLGYSKYIAVKGRRGFCFVLLVPMLSSLSKERKGTWGGGYAVEADHVAYSVAYFIIRQKC